MDVVITEWALNSYLELVADGAFSRDEYKETIRPDVKRLKNHPNDVKFGQGKFWSAATDSWGQTIADGYKMKWHNMGNGRVNIRLPVAMLNEAVLCEAYVKNDPKKEKRRLARFKTHVQLIRQGRYTTRGRLP